MQHRTLWNVVICDRALAQLSIHDDLESLDPESSGRRQRTGRRSRNAACETRPNYRESSANQRGTSPNASESSTSQQLSNQEDFYHPDQEVFGAHEWWAVPFESRQTRGRVRSNQRGTNTYQRGAHVNQRGTNTYQRGPHTNQRGINTYQRGAYASQRGTNTYQRGTNVKNRGTNTNQSGANADQRGANANQRGANANQRGANANQRVTFSHLRGTRANQRVANANQRGASSQRQSKQHGTQTFPRQANQRGLPILPGSGPSLNRRGESVIRGRTSSSHRGTNVNWGRSSLERKTPGQQRETSPGPHPLREKVQPFKPRKSKVQQSPRIWIPWKVSVSDSNLGQNQHGTSAGHRWAPEGQRGSLGDQPETPADKRGSPEGHRESLVDQLGTPADQRGSPEGQRGSLVDQLGTPADQCGSPEDQRGSLVEQLGTPADQRGSPEDQRGSLVDQLGTPADQRGSPEDKRGSLVDHRGTEKRGLTADQHETLQQPGLSDAKSPGWRWEEPSPPKVKVEKPPRKSWLKKSVAFWRSKISAASKKPKIKEEQDGNTAKSKQETEKDQSDTPAETIDHEELHKAQTDAEGLDSDSLMFRDGIRRIDMVLAYRQEEGREGEVSEAEARHRRHRSVYQRNLRNEGLELELEHESVSFNGKTWFLKIHIPWATQLRIAGVMGLKLPTKKLISISVKAWSDNKIASYQRRWYVRLRERFYNLFKPTHIRPEPSFYVPEKNYRRREEQFLVKERHTEFSPLQRSLLVMQLLVRAKFDNGANQFGINRLLAADTYVACYPLHEGEYYKSKKEGTYTDRQLLYLDWARASQWYKQQPLWLVHRYFGDQIGLYFAWLGFYTKMLIPPSVVGSLCFLYGVLSVDSGDSIPIKEICDTNGVGNITLCPLCDKACSYQKMYEACVFAQITYLVDNPSTVFFSVFMSLWATTFLVLWKREESVLRWQWDLARADPDENPRPEYEASVTTTRINPVTGRREPYRSPWQNFIRHVAVSTAVFMMVRMLIVVCQLGGRILLKMAISISTVLGVITYRTSMVAVIYSGSGVFLRKYARLFTILTGAVINLIVSEILIRVFTKVALIITHLESPRTETDYEDSVTFKLFIFEFINFYATIVYIAFFKGTFYDHPGDKEARKPFMSIKGDICFQAGCLSELCIMLAVSMIGKQTCHNITEMGFPLILNWWRFRSHRSQTLDLMKPHTSWEKDFDLQDPGHMALYEEYLEMIVQYGFVTLFVAAFPLGPLCALVNNICEIRMDAYKMLTQARRPLLERVEDLGAWYGLLKFLTYLAVVSNAFVIAYTSDFIPRMVYKLVYSPDGTLEGYVNYSLSWFNTSDYRSEWGTDASEWDPPQCAYRGYRNPPEHHQPYGLSPYYWHVFAARLSFVVVFEHVVFTLAVVLQSIIPKVPIELLRQIKREEMLEKEMKYEKNEKWPDMEFLKAMAEGNQKKELEISSDFEFQRKASFTNGVASTRGLKTVKSEELVGSPTSRMRPRRRGRFDDTIDVLSLHI